MTSSNIKFLSLAEYIFPGHRKRKYLSSGIMILNLYYYVYHCFRYFKEMLFLIMSHMSY